MPHSGQWPQFPLLRTSIPGPSSLALAERLKRVECRGVTYLGSDFPVFWERASGAMVEDVDGNVFLDMTAAFGVANVGHNHPDVVASVQRQAGELLHGMGDVHPPRLKVELLEALARVLPGDLGHGILGSSGSDAVEAARKVCARYTGKPRLIAFDGAYHGLSYGALEATARADFREPFQAQLSGVVTHLPYPHPYHAGAQRSPSQVLELCLAQVRAALDAPDGPQIGGVLVEPMQGRGGTVVPPAGFLGALRALCDERGLLLIVDEIYTGFGRTGRMFACDHEGVVPDLMCLGKGMTGGFPISVCVGRPHVMAAMGISKGEALHTQTFLGNPLGAAAALAAIGVIERESLPTRAEQLGSALKDQLRQLAARHTVIGDVRGCGLMVAVELVEDRHTRTPAVGMGAAVMSAALAKGVLFLPSGPSSNVLAFSPPLIISEAQLDLAVSCLDEVLAGFGSPKV